jgi:hypothetical protein
VAHIVALTASLSAAYMRLRLLAMPPAVRSASS